MTLPLSNGWSNFKALRYQLPLRFWYSKSYWETAAFLQASQWWSEERLADYQLTQLKNMLRHCALHVPFYRRLFRQVGFDHESVRSASDLARLPLLDKETVRLNRDEFLADNIRAEERTYYTTGGTMGKPLGLYGLAEGGWHERAFMDVQWERVGFRPSEKRAMLKGGVVTSERHWTYDPAMRAFVFSNFHMTPDQVAEYARVMKKQKIPYLHSYPSAVIDFARHLKDNGIEPPRFRVIFLGSENLYAGQREFIESFFGCRSYSWYGHSENTILAGECEASHDYHIYPQYGYAEVVKEDGKPARVEGDMGELVGTSLYNLAMPLVRYRTDDWAVLGSKSCQCGRHYQLLRETRGRWLQEMLVGKLDNLISMTALNLHSNVFDQVQQFQFYQREKGRAELRLVPKPGYSEKDGRAILGALQAKIGDTMEIELSFPSAIPLTPRGKYKFVIQELDTAADRGNRGSKLDRIG
jgi:phenylacetate-CoA ligase